MKAILSYGTYFNQGKNYQIKFIYNNEAEAKFITSYLKPFVTRKVIKPIYNNQKYIDKTNINEEILIPFISMLINIYNCNIRIGNQEYNSFNLSTIQDAIDKLHLNATLNKGDFLVLEDTYYLTFNYGNEEQKEELLYYFNCILNYPDIYPVSINKFGKLTSKNNGPIIGTNIPEEKLPEILKIFIEKYDMIINIGNTRLKNSFDLDCYNKAIAQINQKEKPKILKKKIQGAR